MSSVMLLLPNCVSAAPVLGPAESYLSHPSKTGILISTLQLRKTRYEQWSNLSEVTQRSEKSQKANPVLTHPKAASFPQQHRQNPPSQTRGYADPSASTRGRWHSLIWPVAKDCGLGTPG